MKKFYAELKEMETKKAKDKEKQKDEEKKKLLDSYSKKFGKKLAEINPESYAMCVAEMLIKGEGSENAKRMIEKIFEGCAEIVNEKAAVTNPEEKNADDGKSPDAQDDLNEKIKEE